MTPAEELELLDQLSADVEAQVLVAYQRAMDLMRRGVPPRDAITRVMDSFTGEYADLMANALSAVLQRSIGSESALAINIGPVSLSRKLYAEGQDISNIVQGIVQRNARGYQDSKRLALQLFEGYNFREPDAEPLQINPDNPRLPKYMREILEPDPVRRKMAVAFARLEVDNLSTPALRAAYSELLDAIDDIQGTVGRDELEKTLKTAFYERVRYFAERIARTEAHRAYAQREAQILLEDEDVEYVQIRRSRTSTAPCICDLITGRDQYGLGKGVYPKKSAPNPTFHPFCLPGDALITSAVGISAVTRRWHDGDMVVITTASNKRLTATVNHPVLTINGWIPAGLLNVGGNVISRVVKESVAGYSFVDDNHQHMPASIAEIANAFFASGKVTAREVPVSSEHFHGDGVASQIAVVGAYRELWDRVDAEAAQMGENLFFNLTHARATGLFGKSALDQRLKTALGAFDGGVSICSECAPFFSTELAHSDKAGLTATSGRDASGLEPPVYDVSADVELARQIQNGSTGAVFADDIVNIKRYAFHGHVYNLQTSEGHYTCNDIVTHNCKCIVSPRLDLNGRQAQENSEADQYFLNRLSEPIAAKIAGSQAKLARVMAGESAVAVHNASSNPVYRIVNLEQAANAYSATGP